MGDALEHVITSGNFSQADTRLVVIGKTGVGKSSTCNTLIGRAAFKSWVGASSVTRECQQETAERAGRTIQVVDTPGLFDTEIVNAISTKITECVALSSPGPHAILLVIRVGRFTEEDMNTVEEVKKWFGVDMLRYLLIVFTGQDDLVADGVVIEDYISGGPASLQQVVTQANSRYLTINNRASNEDKESFRDRLLTMVDEMVEANGGSYYTTAMYHQAEERIRLKEEEKRQRQEEELKRQKEEIEQTIKSQFSKMLDEQDQQMQRLNNELESLRQQGQQNNIEYNDKVNELNQKVQQAQSRRTQMENDLREQERNLQVEFGKNENERQSNLAAFQSKITSELQKKESEFKQFSDRIEQERIAIEKEMKRRAEEKRLRDQEEHNRRMAALEEERQRELERQRQEQQLQAQREAELQRQRAEAEAAARRHRHRHWHRHPHRHGKDYADQFELGEATDIEADQRFLEEVYSKRSFVRDELRIVLIGKTGSGKSATGNTITGKNTFVSKLSGSSITEICQGVMFERFGRSLQIVDTPGLFDTRADNAHITKEIKKCVLMTSPGIHALILVSKVGRFTEEEKKTVEYFKKVFGDGLSNYLIILFTGKDELDVEDTTIQNYVRTAPPALQQLVAESNGRYLSLNNRAPKEEKDAFAQELISFIDRMVQSNGGKCYTTSMFRKAEAVMKKREAEELKKLEEEKRREREAIENSIKEKYDGVMKEQDSKMKNLQCNLEEIHQKSKEEQWKHEQAVEGLKSELQRAEDERKQIEIDRKKWEEERRKEMQKSEEERNKAMLMMMDKMEEDRRRREQEMDNRMKAAEEERKRREEEMRRREEERERREEEQRRRMKEVEEQREKQLEQMRAEQRRQQEQFEQRLQQQARENARAQSSGGGGCTIL